MERPFASRGDLLRWILSSTASPLLLGTLCILVVVSVDVALPRVFGEYLIDQVLIERNFAVLSWIAGGGVVLFLLKGLFTYGQVYLLTYVGQRLVYTLRRALYSRMLQMSVRQHASFPKGSLIARMTSDLGVVQSAVTAGFGDFVQHGISLLAIVVMLFVLNWELALVSLVLLPAVAWAIREFGSRVRTYTARLQERIAGLTSTLQQSIDGIRVVKAFRMEKALEQEFDEDNAMSFVASMKSTQAMATVTPVVEMLLVATMLLVVWWGARYVLAGKMSAGGLISFLAYLAMVTRPIGFLTKSLNLLQQAVSALDRILEVLRLPEERTSGRARVAIGRPEGRITFERVTFAYRPGEEALKDVSFDIRPGETIGIVGPSGAGKSTVVNLLLQFYEPDSGLIRIDGRDIREIDAASLRRWIGLVPQETLLFHMSVADNIAAGRTWLDRAAIEEAARLANAHEFITALPQGYDTIIGPGGTELSGGQRQRIAIARAIAGDPSILVLDEATSALDTESERQVRQALQRVRKNRTTIIVAHRLATLRHADRVLVMEGGRIVQSGTHEELAGAAGMYRRLFGSE